MPPPIMGVLQTAIGVAAGVLDRRRLRAGAAAAAYGESLVVYTPRRRPGAASGAAAPPFPTLVVVSPPLLGSHESPNVASLVRACLRRGWACAVHNRPAGDPQSVFGNTDSFADAVRLAARSVPAGRCAVVGMSTGSFNAARCLPLLEEMGVSAAVLMANGLSLEGMEPLVSPRAVAYVCRKVARRLGVPSPGSRKLTDLCGSVGVDPRELDCTRALVETRVPTLCINSANDPVVPRATAPLFERIARRNANFRFETTRNGGHLGCVGVLGRRYAMEAALDFIEFGGPAAPRARKKRSSFLSRPAAALLIALLFPAPLPLRPPPPA